MSADGSSIARPALNFMLSISTDRLWPLVLAVTLGAISALCGYGGPQSA